MRREFWISLRESPENYFVIGFAYLSKEEQEQVCKTRPAVHVQEVLPNEISLTREEMCDLIAEIYDDGYQHRDIYKIRNEKLNELFGEET